MKGADENSRAMNIWMALLAAFFIFPPVRDLAIAILTPPVMLLEHLARLAGIAV
jgi:hypothetical protein